MAAKDIKAKEYLQNNEHFADLFNYHLFDGKQVLLPTDLSERDTVEKISVQEITALERIRDILKFTIIKQNSAATFVLLGLEIQNKVHYAMPIRVLLYDAMQYAAQVKEIAKQHKISDYDNDAEFLSGFKKTDKILPVITVVVFLSAFAWDGPRSLHDMMKFSHPDLKRFVNDYPLQLIIPAEINDFEKFRTEVGALLEIIKASGDKDAMRSLLHSKKQYHNLKNETIQTINSTIGTQIKIHKKGGKIDMCNAIEEMINDAKFEERSEFADAIKLIRQGADSIDSLTARGIAEETAKMALEVMLQPV